MRRKAILLAVVLVAAACGGEDAETTTTTTAAVVEQPSTTSTITTSATVESTTEMEVAGPVDICRGRAELWEAEATYVADCFVEPVSFQPGQEGWASSTAGDTWLLVRWKDPAEPGFVVWVGMIAVYDDGLPAEVLSEILSIDGIGALSEPVSDSIADLVAVSVDVEGEEGREGLSRGGCTDGTAVSFRSDEPGYVIGSTAYNKGSIGVGACQVVRVWVVQFEDRSITIIGGTADRARHEEAVAKIESLFEGMSFDTGGGS